MGEILGILWFVFDVVKDQVMPLVFAFLVWIGLLAIIEHMKGAKKADTNKP